MTYQTDTHIAPEHSRDIADVPLAREYEALETDNRVLNSVSTCHAIDGLADIRSPDQDLVIWQRNLPGSLSTWLDGLDADNLPDLRVAVRPGDAQRALIPHLEECGMPAGTMRDLLLSDVSDLACVFAEITHSEFVDIRLESVSHDACWKFHRDYVEARLLTTYRGPATQWVQPQHASQAIEEQRDFGGPMEQMTAGDVAVFKGSCAGPGCGIVHRSPPIEGTGCTRLLLCLNQLSEASPAHLF